MPIANISKVWIERTCTPLRHDCLSAVARSNELYIVATRLISWRATFRYCQMCRLVINLGGHPLPAPTYSFTVVTNSAL